MGCIRVGAKVILAPIFIPYKLCCGWNSNKRKKKRESPQQLIENKENRTVPFVSTSTDSNLNNTSTSSQQQPDDAPSQLGHFQQPSSSELPLPTAEYEVFLSFRGPDTRHQFSEILGLFLRKNKIRTFLDDNELRQGDKIAPSLARAIEQSKIYVPILSEKYAESKWCLNELAEMMDCYENRNKGHIILPIFYQVEPRDVGHQTGPYEIAFQQHANKYDAQTVKTWRNALQKVGKIKGWTVKSNNQHAAVIDCVSSVVWSHINKNDNLLDADELVGIDEHVKAVTEKLRLGSPDMTMVGLHGFGGIGKTTIARAVYHKLSAQFDRRCFLEDIRTTQEGKDGIITLQQKLISNVMRMDYVELISNVNEGRKLIEDRVSQFRVLIVLDDVDENFNFKQFLGDPKQFDSRSRFIVTSRNTRVLSTLNENRCELYEVQAMNRQLSLQLFCKYAFQGNSPLPGYETLAKKIVKKTEGVPLVLKVVGSDLFRQEKSFWQDKLAQLGKVPDREVIERLKINYDTLNYEAKQVFLDIACFYIGMNKDIPSYMWSDLELHPVTNVTILVQRSLIKMGDDNELQMHDQLRDMGRAIVREENIEQPWMRSRVWDEKEALKLLQGKKGSSQVKALTVDDASEIEKLKREHFLNLSELRYFTARLVQLDGDFSDILPNIKWLQLQLDNDIGHHHLANFHMENLVILDLGHSRPLEDRWGGWSQIKMANKLKVLNLSWCSFVNKLPDFPESGSLELLDLSFTDNLGSSLELDIANLWNLKVLLLRHTKLERIIGGTIGSMKMLEDLDLDEVECEHHNLKQVLVDIGELSSLQRLKVTRTSTNLPFPSLPEGVLSDDVDENEVIAMMEAFRKTEAQPFLGKLPVERLKSLCTSFPVVNLSELLQLEVLIVQDCYSGFQIPLADTGWWKASKLDSVMLKHTNIVVTAAADHQPPPPSSSSSSSSSASYMFPSSLTSLQIWDGLETEWLPTLSNLENLTDLVIWECEYLREIVGLEDLLRFNKLETLDITSCPNLESTLLGGRHGTRIVIVDSLKRLCLSKCGGGIPRDLSNFPNLTRLELGDITTDDDDQQEGMGSQVLEGIAHLENLEELQLYGLPSVERLPPFSKLQKLASLSIHDMPRLREIQGLAELKSLVHLELDRCRSLKELDIQGCKNLPPRDLSALKANLWNNVRIKWPPLQESSVSLLHEDSF